VAGYNNGMSNSPVPAASKPASSGKQIMIGIAVVVVMIFAAFGVGLWQGRIQLLVQHSRHEQAIAKLNSQLTQTQHQLSVSENRTALMQASIALYRSAIDLDKRNFGMANAHLKEAAQSLGKIDNQASELKTAEIARLRDAISKANINVAVNLEEQRAQVLSFATQLNALIPEHTSETS
jgi:uncharacterized protein HemX